MATKFPPPSPPFIRARNQGGRQTPKALVLHGTVSSDNRGTARNIAGWWNGPTSPMSSCHYVVDPGEVIQCVGDHSVAYHCGYNDGSIGVEFCDEQTGPASRWRDADSTAILRRAARLTAELCLAYDIEPKRPSIAALKRKGPHGIYGHNDSRLAFGRTTHTDPRDFPWRKFLRMVRVEIKAIVAAAEGEHVESAPQKTTLHLMHISMQFSDNPRQMAEDVDKIFARAVQRNVAWITGTESGPGADPLDDLLREACQKNGYRFYKPSRPTDCWIAVRRDLIMGGWKANYEAVIPGSGSLQNAERRWGPKGVVSVEFDAPIELGHLGVAAAHYLTGARAPGKPSQHGGVNHWDWNEALGRAIGRWGKEVGAGNALVFYGGDQNMADSRNSQPQGDTFFGEPFTSAQDELEKWANTGHGPIDVIASYDRDGRVTAKYVRVLNDKRFFLHTDHFLVEAGYEIEHQSERAQKVESGRRAKARAARRRRRARKA